MPRAIWNDCVIAESDGTVVVEGNHYFPEGSIVAGCLEPSATETVCGWKGTASYFNVVVGDQVNRDAAWVYRRPKPEAAAIRDRIAFWQGVRVET